MLLIRKGRSKLFGKVCRIRLHADHSYVFTANSESRFAGNSESKRARQWLIPQPCRPTLDDFLGSGRVRIAVPVAKSLAICTYLRWQMLDGDRAV
eukprot:523799-Pleurochrysis_carterae.AAC.1